MKCGVPHVSRVALTPRSRMGNAATPKSMRRTRSGMWSSTAPARSSNTFSGLRSRCSTPLAVYVRERVGDLDEDPSNFVGVERLIVREAIGERLPADIRA